MNMLKLQRVLAILGSTCFVVAAIIISIHRIWALDEKWIIENLLGIQLCITIAIIIFTLALYISAWILIIKRNKL